MGSEYGKFDKSVIWATGAMWVDFVGGYLLNGGQPLHTSLGIDSPEYVHTIEAFATALGVSYNFIKPLERDRKKAKLYDKIKEEENSSL